MQGGGSGDISPPTPSVQQLQTAGDTAACTEDDNEDAVACGTVEDEDKDVYAFIDV